MPSLESSGRESATSSDGHRNGCRSSEFVADATGCSSQAADAPTSHHNWAGLGAGGSWGKRCSSKERHGKKWKEDVAWMQLQFWNVGNTFKWPGGFDLCRKRQTNVVLFYSEMRISMNWGPRHRTAEIDIICAGNPSQILGNSISSCCWQ